MWRKKFRSQPPVVVKKEKQRQVEHMTQERVLNTYVDKGEIKLGATTTTTVKKGKLPALLSSVKIPVKQVALSDDLAQGANRLAQAAIVESGQAAVFEPKEHPNNNKGKEEEEEEEEEEEHFGVVEDEDGFLRPDESLVELDEVFDAPPITDLQSYKLRDDRDQMFFRHLRVDDCVPDTLVSKIPRFKDVLSYTKSLENGPKYYEQIVEMVVNSQGAHFPQLEVINRGYIRDFLRAPAKGVKHERACGIAECESLRLSNRLLEKYPHMRKQGLQQGFRCRELILPTQYVKIRQEEKKGRAGRPEKHLSTYPQACFLCHLYLTNSAYWTLLNRRKRRMEPEGFATSLERERSTDATCILHRFVVVVDVVGEYRLKDMLVGDNEPMGIIGPFPRYNVNNYVPFMDQLGRCSWRESDKLVFRLPEQVTGQTDLPDTSSGSTPLGPTTAKAPLLPFLK